MPFLVFRRDNLRYTSGIICGSGSFAVQFGDHFRSGDHLRRCTVLLHVAHILNISLTYSFAYIHTLLYLPSDFRAFNNQIAIVGIESGKTSTKM